MNKYFNNGKNGISNLGNTCYMNAALQCLRYTIPLSYFLIIKQINTNNQLLLEYQKLIKNSWNNNNNIIIPRQFKNILDKTTHYFKGFRQHDSQEFLSYLINQIHDTLKLNNNKSIISELFFGSFEQSVICPNCNNISITYQPFIDLQIPIYQNQSLDFCIKQFINDEKLDNMNMYKCEKCHQSVNATKKIKLHKLPDYLIITLKRFNKLKKLSFNITFPTNNFIINNKSYNLYATINHYGGKSGGHYTANVLHPNKNWYKMNDSSCQKINSNIINNSIYIAFFKRSDLI
jgi:ubiquitin C-terminal hydrolase